MKKFIFLLILMLLTNLVSSCSLTEDFKWVEAEREEAEQSVVSRREEIFREAEWEESKRRAVLRREAKQRTEQELYDKEQEAKYKRLKEEWIEFIQSGEGSVKNKTAQEVKKLVDHWRQYWWIKCAIDNMGSDRDWLRKNAHRFSGIDLKWVGLDVDWWQNAKGSNLEILSLESFYKIFGKPWKTQFIEDKYFLWYVCKDGHPIITVSVNEYDEGWVNILDLNIL